MIGAKKGVQDLGVIFCNHLFYMFDQQLRKLCFADLDAIKSFPGMAMNLMNFINLMNGRLPFKG